ncbi:MAG: beta/gamma crystallin-related protein [Aquabacterium sp.]
MSTAFRSMAVRLARSLIPVLALLAAPWAAAQDVELYDQPDFRGMRLTLSAATGDLSTYGLGARVSSVVITRGQWEFCTQPQYRGACITVGPGRYNRLPPALNDNLASLRPAGGTVGGPVSPPPRPDPRPDPYGQATIVLYAGEYSGPELRLFDAVNDLRSQGFNDTATTVDVLRGTWDLCSDGGFSGECLRFQPGRYALPPALRDRLSSLRPVQAQRPPDRPVDPVVPGRPDGGHGRPWPNASPAIVFYENRDFNGRQMPLNGATPSFNALDFNDRASSVEIFRGRWQLCRHADFGGECVVFGPGRHVLDGRLHDAVSSARPVWGRDDRGLPSIGAVTLHDQLDLRGRHLFVEGEVRNLRDQSFNDCAVAIEVHGGQWELCNSSDHRGRCLVFGPGWHRLPDGLAGELSSLRPR